jgi:hypothetical protein
VWTVYVRDQNLRRQGEIDDYATLEAVRRLNRVGTWTLDLPATSDAALLLAQPGWGVQVVDEDSGDSLTSGPTVDVERNRTGDSDSITVSGVDDMIHLEDRLAHPQPASAAPPYSTSAYDVRTGTASTVISQYVNVNAGPGAIAQRRVPLLTLATDPVVGGSITGRARWQNLREFAEELALSGGGLAFDVTQVGGPGLQFAVRAPVDRTSTVRLSVDLGTLAGYKYSVRAPQVSYVYCGGGGEGTARAVAEGQSPGDIVTWSRRVEQWADRRDTTDSAELAQEIAKRLAEGQGESAVTCSPVDIDGVHYLTDYALGDRVSVEIDDAVITELIREVRLIARPDEQRVLPLVGTPAASTALRLLRRLRSTDTRLINLERR